MGLVQSLRPPEGQFKFTSTKMVIKINQIPKPKPPTTAEEIMKFKKCPYCNQAELKPYKDFYCCYGCGEIVKPEEIEDENTNHTTKDAS